MVSIVNGKYCKEVYTLSQQTSDVLRQLPFKNGLNQQSVRIEGVYREWTNKGWHCLVP